MTLRTTITRNKTSEKPITLEDIERAKQFVFDPTAHRPKCPACGKFVRYGRISEEWNEYGAIGWQCKCGWNSFGL